jgi:hypothetical protein
VKTLGEFRNQFIADQIPDILDLVKECIVLGLPMASRDAARQLARLGFQLRPILRYTEPHQP